jgi:hypothetical protein
VDVIDFVPKLAGSPEVQSDAAATLPEAVGPFSIGLEVLQLLEKPWSPVAAELDGWPGDTQLQRFQPKTQVVLCLARINEQMYVFKHNHIGPAGIIEFGTGCLDRRDEPRARPIAREQREATITGERQEVGMAGNIVAPAAFAAHQWVLLFEGDKQASRKV